MPTREGLPLPGERIHRAVVIASVWLNDDEGTAVLLMLRDAPPYYRLNEVKAAGMGRDGAWGNWAVVTSDDYPNIVPAAAAYVSNGGDY